MKSLQTWADQVLIEMKQDEPVRDVASAADRQNRHHELKAEIDARDDTFANIAESGQAMIKAGHFAANDVNNSHYIKDIFSSSSACFTSFSMHIQLGLFPNIRIIRLACLSCMDLMSMFNGLMPFL